MQAYSNDLRQRVVVAVERAEHSVREITRHFFVDLSTVVRWRQRQRRTGSVLPKPHGAPRAASSTTTTRLAYLLRGEHVHSFKNKSRVSRMNLKNLLTAPLWVR